jgi:hypothetical protein
LLPGRRTILRVLTRRGQAGQKLDHVRGQDRAFRGNEVRIFLVAEIVGDEHLAAVLSGSLG